MNDRELLEMAARAAGIEHHGIVFGENPIHCGAVLLLDGRFDRYWNPLTDDGDVLRLAVKLRINIHFMDLYGVILCVSDCGCEQENLDSNYNENIAATRRAIVRAAAAIGRQMEAAKAGE